MKKLLLLLCVSLFAQLSFAHYYPIEPRPLRKLVTESDFIVRGVVVKLDRLPDRKKKERDNFWDRDFAVIQVKEVWQGKITESTIEVYYTAGLICPAPPHFMEGIECLVFLDSLKERKGFSVHALSYGVKNGLFDEDFGFYKARVNEMKTIAKITDSREQEAQILDWLVRCAEQKATRWEGVYELLPESDFMSYYDRSGRVRRDIYLNREQMNRLFNALAKEDQIDYGDLGLLDIVIGIDDARLFDKIKKGLASLDTNYLWVADRLMDRIVEFSDDIELSDLQKKFNEVGGYDEKSEANRKKIYFLFLDAMKNTEYMPKVKAIGNTG